MKLLVLLACLVSVAGAQVFTFSKEQMLKYTAKNPYERFEDGRPKVPGELLQEMKNLTIEDVWGVLPRNGFPNQYEGNWQILHPGRKLVGRAVTAQFMPMRGDLNDIINADGKAKGYRGGQNQWVIDMLQPNDVIVVDLLGQVEGATFVGDNLAVAIMAATGAGMVVNGGIRDLEGIAPLDMQAYFRGVHPSAINRNKFMLTGINIPVNVGNATVMPGDVVFGDRGGVYFIPPAHVEEILDRAVETHIHDEWTKNKFIEGKGKYKSTDLYGRPHDPALIKEYEEYKAKRLAERKQRRKE